MGNTTSFVSGKIISSPDAIVHFSFVDVDLIVVIKITNFLLFTTKAFRCFLINFKNIL